MPVDVIEYGILMGIKKFLLIESSMVYICSNRFYSGKIKLDSDLKI